MFHVRCMFAGNGRDDAAAVSVADGFDGPLLGQQFADRLRGRHADCVERKGLEPKAGGCDLFYTLSRGSYQRSAGTFVDDGKCGADGADHDDWIEGTGTRGDGTADDRAGIAVSA